MRVATALLATVPALANAGSEENLRIGRGIYLSDSVALSLRHDGTYVVEELGGARVAQGRYSTQAGLIDFLAGRGNVGGTHFPLRCRAVAVFGGFKVRPAQPACRAFEGLSFRRAN